jgi:NADP-reducing hydrogenase subunit HndB
MTVGKIKISDLDKIKERVKKTMSLRSGEATARIIVHMGTCGIAAGARDVMSAVMDEIEKGNLTTVHVTTSGCAGLCSREPMATVERQGEPAVKYIDLTPDKIRKIVKEHVQEGKIVKDYALAIGHEQAH